jgi:hypothetical protein
MEWNLFEDKINKGDWRVEGINHESEGEVEVAIFCGVNAEQRARNYYDMCVEDSYCRQNPKP